jgi:hypothetical protein
MLPKPCSRNNDLLTFRTGAPDDATNPVGAERPKAQLGPETLGAGGAIAQPGSAAFLNVI